MDLQPLEYVSTRGRAPALGFADVLLEGLAQDGGLYVPRSWPALEHPPTTSALHRPYVDVALEVMWPYVYGSIDRDDFEKIVIDSYAAFAHPDVTPLTPIGDNLYLLELFHGPTLAFKDVALQLVGRLFDHELTRRRTRVTIVGATSGDTGSAAIEACRDRDALDIVILHPAGRVSEVQRRQMTTVLAPNVHNVAIEGTFDDCQDLVKAMFNHTTFRRDHNLSAVNSINWARVMAQIVYYVAAAERLGCRKGSSLSFAVPTGNFGNVFAGYAAQAMGLPIAQFVVASNRNDILTEFFNEGTMTVGEVQPTWSPSMDIQVSSNLERLLFDLYERSGAALAGAIDAFRATGRFELQDRQRGRLRRHWRGERVSDDETLAVIGRTYRELGVLIDPHTAVGLGGAQRSRAEGRSRTDIPMVVLSTAHPAKFPEAVERATGVRPPLPDHLADLLDRPERCDTLPNDLAAVMAHVARVTAAR